MSDTNLRASEPHDNFADNLGVLTELAGMWVGDGYNVMSLPDFDSNAPSTGPKDFRLKINAIREQLQFIPIGGPIPNRGAVTALGATTGQADIKMYGLTYLQHASDAATNAALHIEPGVWLNIPASTIPEQGPTLVRMGTVPHGNTFLAQSVAVQTMPTKPMIGPASTTPAGLPVTPEMLAQFHNPVPPPPAGMDPAWVLDPNKALTAAIASQDIVSTTLIEISTGAEPCGILNIPFSVSNAKPLQLDAMFWIETVRQPDGTSFMQLQYSQTVLLTFLGINWPHVTVATLVKQ